MTKKEVIAILKSNPSLAACYMRRDTTGQWFEPVPVWLDGDGKLIQSHPTQPRGTCSAPDDGAYRVE